MIGAPLPASVPFFSASTLRPVSAPVAPAAGSGSAWLDGLGSAAGAGTLRADVAADQRGLSVSQHAERVLAALLA